MGSGVYHKAKMKTPSYFKIVKLHECYELLWIKLVDEIDFHIPEYWKAFENAHKQAVAIENIYYFATEIMFGTPCFY